MFFLKNTKKLQNNLINLENFPNLHYIYNKEIKN